MADETYDYKAVAERSIDVGDRYRFVGIALKTGETMHNPLSTKGPIFGPQNVEIWMHPSSWSVRLGEIGRCMGQVEDTNGNGGQCAHLAENGATRCPKHRVEAVTA
jgi:hypothetical protein